MKIHKLITGPVQENCYILEKDGQALVVDPGSDGERIIHKIEDLDLKPLHILLTHAHFDHIGALDQVRDYYHIPASIHEIEKDYLLDPDLNFSSMTGQPFTCQPADHLFTEEVELEIGPFDFKVVHTPGHSPGSVSFIFQSDKQVIAGDALFRESIGRTDSFNADGPTLLDSIQTKLLSLDDDFTVYPGHGQATSIGHEKSYNPFF